MERLTFVDEEGMVLFDNPAGFPEDIGFTIRELAENEEWEILDKIAERLANAEQRLQNYEKLEEKGLLLRLPCKVGDTVYSLDRFCGGYSLDCPSRPCKECSDYQLEIYEGKFRLKDIYDFGKTVFLTQAEAEEALRDIQREIQYDRGRSVIN